MADTCIVCLSDLLYDEPHLSDARGEPSSLSHAEPTSPPIDDNELIAHLLPCGHNLHDQCLKPWVERANSCPICRTVFNQVECRRFLNGAAISSYAVQDKRQAVEIDSDMILSSEEMDEVCLRCGNIAYPQDVMYCDGCEDPLHVRCTGHQITQDVWHCERCYRTSRTRTSTRSGRPSRSTRGNPYQTAAWRLVWQSVWDRLNQDAESRLDDSQQASSTPEFAAWQRRFDVASSQGAASRFRDAAVTIVDQRQETQEELCAWKALEKAREPEASKIASSSLRRKRKSASTTPRSTTASPPMDHQALDERQFKRPRTKKYVPTDRSVSSKPCIPVVQMSPRTPSFLGNLLDEVEQQPAPVARSTLTATGQLSPPLTSPAASPQLSTSSSPRASPLSPPPALLLDRSTPISRRNAPPKVDSISPARSAFLLYSPIDVTPLDTNEANGGRPSGSPHHGHTQAQSSHSPSRDLSYSTKTEIQRMVKIALGPSYKDGQMSKDHYTAINRDVSRMLYDRIGHADALAHQADRNKWQKMAVDAVIKAISALKQ